MFQGAQYTKDTKIDGKVAIITGANTGIGLETAIDLASRGGKVYIACRDVIRGENALKEIKDRSKSTQVFFLQLDLASLDSVREFSRKFHQIESRLDILMCNAGIMATPKGVTKDGFEMQLGVNHLGHFLLTNLLLDKLKASAPSRIIVVSSSMHKIGKIYKDDLMSERSYWRWLAYGQSKLANVLFVRELAKKLKDTGVTANSLHPGAVTTELQRNVDFASRVFMAPLKSFWKTPKSGAQTQIRLAVDPELENVTGKYFDNCEETTPSYASRDDETAAWLWKKSEELTQLN